MALEGSRDEDAGGTLHEEAMVRAYTSGATHQPRPAAYVDAERATLAPLRLSVCACGCRRASLRCSRTKGLCCWSTLAWGSPTRQRGCG